MRVLRTVLFVVLLSAPLFAANLTLRVLDPHSHPVAGAQVLVFVEGSSEPLAVLSTASEGTATLNGLAVGRYRLAVLAPGFAPQTAAVALPLLSAFTVNLAVAGASEIVVVTATRTPMPLEESGASVATLEAGQLQTMQPVAANDAVRFLPGAVVNTVGQRGGQSSLFVRGGDSRYNKVLIDGVPVNDAGGIFDFGVVPLAGMDRLEFLRGAQSTLYGSDAMTSVVQMFSRAGSTESPEIRFGADGGNFSTAHGYASLAGVQGRFDYNLFGDQFNTSGSGINDDYSNSLEGANLGARLSDRATLRIRTRHSTTRTGVQGEWQFDGVPSLPPESNERARQNNLVASAELSITGPSRWQHRFTGFEYSHRTLNENDYVDPNRLSPFGPIDFLYRDTLHANRAGLEYQGGYVERSWAQTTFGYEFEDENAFLNSSSFGSPVTTQHGARRNHALYAQQAFVGSRISLVLGGRYVHNDTFGDKGVPRAALALQVLRGGRVFSGTRLRFSYATGIKEPRFEEVLPNPPSVIGSPNLKAEENCAFEAGFEQGFFSAKYGLSAIYFNNQFRNQIDFQTLSFSPFSGKYININKSMAHGVEVELKGQLARHLQLNGGYTYDSTQILVAPFAFDAFHASGAPLLRRPKHSGSLLLSYLGTRWGSNVGGSFVGRRTDSDFLGFNINHAPGYARVDLGGWYTIQSHVTAYLNLENALDRRYQEVVGYPALPINFRAGLRFRFGGS
jgi:outer membrane cobalamin receptor